MNPFNWFKAYYSGLYLHALNRPRKIPCFAGSLFFFMDPSGDIYSCLSQRRKIGDIKNFSDIKSQVIKGCEINCWQTCTTSPTLKSRPYLAMPWIIKSQVKNTLGYNILE